MAFKRPILNKTSLGIADNQLSLELKNITDKEVIGYGGRGVVYEGIYFQDTVVVIKILSG